MFCLQVKQLDAVVLTWLSFVKCIGMNGHSFRTSCAVHFQGKLNIQSKATLAQSGRQIKKIGHLLIDKPGQAPAFQVSSNQQRALHFVRFHWFSLVIFV